MYWFNVGLLICSFLKTMFFLRNRQKIFVQLLHIQTLICLIVCLFLFCFNSNGCKLDFQVRKWLDWYNMCYSSNRYGLDKNGWQTTESSCQKVRLPDFLCSVIVVAVGKIWRLERWYDRIAKRTRHVTLKEEQKILFSIYRKGAIVWESNKVRALFVSKYGWATTAVCND